MSEAEKSLLDEIDEIKELADAVPSDGKDEGSPRPVEEASIVKGALTESSDSVDKSKEEIVDEADFWANQAKKERKVVKVSRGEDPSKRRGSSQADRVARLSNPKVKVQKVTVDVNPKPFSSTKIKKNAPVPSSVYDASIIQIEGSGKSGPAVAQPIGDKPSSAAAAAKPASVAAAVGSGDRPAEERPPVPLEVGEKVEAVPEPEVLDGENFDNEMSSIMRKINLVNSKISQEEGKIVKDSTSAASASASEPSASSLGILGNGLSNYAGAFQLNSVSSMLSGSPVAEILSPKKDSSRSEGESPAKFSGFSTSPSGSTRDKSSSIKSQVDEWYQDMQGGELPDLSEAAQQVSRALKHSEQQIGRVNESLTALKRDELASAVQREENAEASVQDALRAAMDKVADALKRGEIDVSPIRHMHSAYEQEEEEEFGSPSRYYLREDASGLLSKIEEGDEEGSIETAPASHRDSRQQFDAAALLARSGAGSSESSSGRTPRSGAGAKSVMFADQSDVIEDDGFEEEEGARERGVLVAAIEAASERAEALEKSEPANDVNIEPKDAPAAAAAEEVAAEDLLPSRGDATFSARIAAHKDKIARMEMGIYMSDEILSAQEEEGGEAARASVVVRNVAAEFSKDGDVRQLTPDRAILINTSYENSDIFNSPLFDNSAPRAEGAAEDEHKAPYEKATESSHNVFVSDDELSRIEAAFEKQTSETTPAKGETEHSGDNKSPAVKGPAPPKEETSAHPETHSLASAEEDRPSVLDRYRFLADVGGTGGGDQGSGDIVRHFLSISNSLMNIEKSYESIENIENNVENYLDYRVAFTPTAAMAQRHVADAVRAGMEASTSIYRTEDAHFDPSVDLPPAVSYGLQKAQRQVLRATNSDADLFDFEKPSKPEGGKDSKAAAAATAAPVRKAAPPPSGKLLKPTAASARRAMMAEKSIAVSMANNIVTSIKNRRVSKSGGGRNRLDSEDTAEDADRYAAEDRAAQNLRQHREMYGEDFLGGGGEGQPGKKKKKGKKKRAKAAAQAVEPLVDEHEFDIRPGQVEDDLFNNLGGYLEQQQRVLKANKALNYSQLLSKAKKNVALDSDQYADSEMAAILGGRRKRAAEDKKLSKHFAHIERLEAKLASAVRASNDMGKSSIVGYTNNKTAEYIREQNDRIQRAAREPDPYTEVHQRQQAQIRQLQEQQKPENNNVTDSINERFYNPYKQPYTTEENTSSQYYRALEPAGDAKKRHQQKADEDDDEEEGEGGEGEEEGEEKTLSNESAYANKMMNEIRSDYKFIQSMLHKKQLAKEQASVAATSEQERRQSGDHRASPSPLTIKAAHPEPLVPNFSHKSPSAAEAKAVSFVALHQVPVPHQTQAHHSPASVTSQPTLPKIHFRMSEALLREPAPHTTVIADSSEVTAHRIAKATKANKKIHLMESHVSSSRATAAHQSFEDLHNSEVEEEEEASPDSHRSAGTHNSGAATATKRTSAEEVYYRLKHNGGGGGAKGGSKSSPQAVRASAERELSHMIKRQREYDLLASQINADVDNKSSSRAPPHQQQQQEAPVNLGLLAEEADDVSHTVTSTTSAAGAGVKKAKKAGGGGKKKPARKKDIDDYDSDDFDDIIEQSVKHFDLKPPKAVKPSNFGGNPRINNVRYATKL